MPRKLDHVFSLYKDLYNGVEAGLGPSNDYLIGFAHAAALVNAIGWKDFRSACDLPRTSIPDHHAQSLSHAKVDAIPHGNMSGPSFNLSSQSLSHFADLAALKALSLSQVLSRALALYDVCLAATLRGERLVIVDPSGSAVREVTGL